MHLCVTGMNMWHQPQIGCTSLWDHFRTNISRCCQTKIIANITSNKISNNGHCKQIAGQLVVYNYEKPIRSRLMSGTEWMITILRFNGFLVMGQRGAGTIETKSGWRHALYSGCCPGVPDYCLQIPLAEARQGIESATPHIDIQCKYTIEYISVHRCHFNINHLCDFFESVVLGYIFVTVNENTMRIIKKLRPVYKMLEREPLSFHIHQII